MSFIAVWISTGYVTKFNEQISRTSDPSILSGSEEVVRQFASVYRTVLVKLIILAIVSFLIILCFYALARLIIWSLILDKKIELKLYPKFLALNIIWVVIGLLLFLINTRYIIPKEFVAQMILLPLFAYISQIIPIKYLEQKTIFKTFKDSLIIAFKKIHLMILPCLLILLVFGLYVIILSIFAWKIISIPSFIMAILLVLFLAWARQFFAASFMLIRS
ncbi:hypothetical protein ACFL0W_06145 [Nanoarchaeota archaeon]